MNPMPRFSGRAIRAEDGWYWEMIVSVLGEGGYGNIYTTKKRFKNKEECIEDLKAAIQYGCDEAQKAFGMDPSGEYIDMKTNETRRWDKSNEH